MKINLLFGDAPVKLDCWIINSTDDGEVYAAVKMKDLNQWCKENQDYRLPFDLKESEESK